MLIRNESLSFSSFSLSFSLDCMIQMFTFVLWFQKGLFIVDVYEQASSDRCGHRKTLSTDDCSNVERIQTGFAFLSFFIVLGGGD